MGQTTVLWFRWFRQSCGRWSVVMRVCLHVCVCVCVCVCAHICMVVASTALVVLVIWTAMYQTSYSDYLTGLPEPLSPPYISVTLASKMSQGEYSDSHQCHL